MPKVFPYPFRSENLCICHQMCKDRFPTGAHLWVRCVEANGGWDFLKTWFRLDELSDVPHCSWARDLEGSTWQGTFGIGYTPVSGVGVPFFWQCVNLIFDDLGGSGSFETDPVEITEQLDCRGMPDLPCSGFSSQPGGGEPEESFEGTLEFRWGNSDRPSNLVDD